MLVGPTLAALFGAVLQPDSMLRFDAAHRVAQPAAIALDVDGRYWSVDRAGRVLRSGRDGRTTVFLDRLVDPRDALPLDGRTAFVLEPPNLHLAVDLDDDGRADDVRLVGAGLAAATGLVLVADGTLFIEGTDRTFRWDGRALRPRDRLDRRYDAVVERADGSILGVAAGSWYELRAASSVPTAVTKDAPRIAGLLLGPERLVAVVGTAEEARAAEVVADASWRWSLRPIEAPAGPFVLDGSGLAVLRPDGIAFVEREQGASPSTFEGDLQDDVALINRLGRGNGAADAAREALLLAARSSEERRRAIVARLTEAATGASEPQARRRAFGLLERLDAADEALRARLLSDPSPDVRIAALAGAHGELVLEAIDDDDAAVAAAALERGALLGSARSTATAIDAWLDAVASAAVRSGEDQVFAAAIRASRGDEAAVLERVLAAGDELRPWRREALVSALVDGLLDSPVGARRALDIAAEALAAGDRATASTIVGRAAARVGSRARRPAQLTLDRAPSSYRALLDLLPPAAAATIDPWIRWPERTDVPLPTIVATPEETIALGRRLYASCITCHGPSGLGQPGIYPPLAQSEWVTGDPERFAKILLHGLRGRLVVRGVEYNGLMPKPIFGATNGTDEELAAVMSYVRQAFGNDAPAVPPDLVGRVRSATQDRTQPWSVEELSGGSGGR
jgi:mono/diheme cytochrome c family protein